MNLPEIKPIGIEKKNKKNKEKSQQLSFDGKRSSLEQRRSGFRRALQIVHGITFALGVGALVVSGYFIHVVPHSSICLALMLAGGSIVLLSAVGSLGARFESNGCLLVYFYANVFFVAFIALISFAALAFQDSLEVWVKHHLNDVDITYLRTQVCCQTYESFIVYLEKQLFILGVLGFGLVAFLGVGSWCCVQLITLPIILKSMFMIMNVTFIGMGLGIIAYGALAMQKPHLEAGNEWIAYLFFGIGTLLTFLSILGIIGAKRKDRKLLLLHILGMCFCLVALLGCSVGSFAFTDVLLQKYALDPFMGRLACQAGFGGCSNCSEENSLEHLAAEAAAQPCLGVVYDLKEGYWKSCNATNVEANCELGLVVLHARNEQAFFPTNIARCGACPQWTREEMMHYVQTELQFSGLIATLIALLMLLALFATMLLRRSLVKYQTDSI